MAKAEAAAEDGAPKKGKKKLMIIVLALLLAGGGGGGAWFFLGKKKNAEEQAEVEDTKSKKKTEFMTIEPAFTVNLREEESERYLQTGLVFEVSDPKTAERIKEFMPAIRSKLLLLLSAKSTKDIDNPEGKEELAEEIIASVKGSIGDAKLAKGLENVHFSLFVIQ